MMTNEKTATQYPEIDDAMRTLLRQWASCMEVPRAKGWEKKAEDLQKATRLLLGNLSRDEHERGHRD